jgi:hypothetical protein
MGKQKEITMTIFEEIEAKGIEKGIEKGELRLGRDVVLLALRKKFARVPKRIESVIRRVSDPIILESLVGEVIVSETLDEFAAVLK